MFLRCPRFLAIGHLNHRECWRGCCPDMIDPLVLRCHLLHDWSYLMDLYWSLHVSSASKLKIARNVWLRDDSEFLTLHAALSAMTLSIVRCDMPKCLYLGTTVFGYVRAGWSWLYLITS